jgi:hypothetical protein
MPPRFAYWTILAGGLPTSFRAAEREDLLPTFNRIREKHPDAEMKYFARGQLWSSADEAKRALQQSREREARGHAQRSGERRGRDWRPGGEHRDPRQRFADAKKQRNQKHRQQRWQHRQPGESESARGSRPPRLKPHGDRFRDKLPRREFRQGGGGHRLQRNQETPTRPPRPDREPPPGREPKPDPPPRPSEPEIKPPGPPERGKRPRGPRPRKRQP